MYIIVLHILVGSLLFFIIVLTVSEKKVPGKHAHDRKNYQGEVPGNMSLGKILSEICPLEKR